MKTTINVMGQISGNFKLASALQTWESEQRSTMFNGFSITYPTRKQAYKALWEAYKKLRADEPEFAKGGMSYSPKQSLTYDASQATIQD